MEALEKFFQLKEYGTNIKTEVVAGATTFFAMAYILAVNPAILSATGMDKGALFTATALAAVVGTLIMALVARLPIALAPGMGLNAFFAFTVVLGMGYSWQFALTAVFLEGIIFILMTFFNIREAIICCIPANLKKAITAGIGLFIAHIGYQKGMLVVDNPATLLGPGSLTSGPALVCITVVIVAGVMLYKKITGALLIGIFAGTILGIPLGVTHIENFSLVSMPSSIEPLFFQFEFDKVFTLDMATVLFTFLFVDLFDTVGLLIGVTDKANLLDENGNIPRCKQALFADAIATTFGAMVGTSTVTSYAESAAGVEAGGRTGLTALTTGILMIVALFFSPVFLMIPGAATGGALILVGVFMASTIKDIDFNDFTEAIPAFVCFMGMPLTYGISEGIIHGILAYVLLKVLSGKAKTVQPLTYVVAAIFILKIVLH